MTILGIDPGLATVGYGVISSLGGKHTAIEYGAILTPAHTLLEERLEQIYNDMNAIFSRHSIDMMAIEELFFNKNVKTAVDVCQARGVILLSAQKNGVPIYEYTPLQIKQAVVGYGRAEKQQVMYMTKTLLHLESVPKPDDTADALAVAITHASAYRKPITFGR